MMSSWQSKVKVGHIAHLFERKLYPQPPRAMLVIPANHYSGVDKIKGKNISDEDRRVSVFVPSTDKSLSDAKNEIVVEVSILFLWNQLLPHFV